MMDFMSAQTRHGPCSQKEDPDFCLGQSLNLLEPPSADITGLLTRAEGPLIDKQMCGSVS
jgi:hypothetical protein